MKKFEFIDFNFKLDKYRNVGLETPRDSYLTVLVLVLVLKPKVLVIVFVLKA